MAKLIEEFSNEPEVAERVGDEELEADGRETSRFWGACAVKRRFFGEEERRLVDGEASDCMVFVDGPEKLRAESVLVESDGVFGVVDGEHRSDLNSHGSGGAGGWIWQQ